MGTARRIDGSENYVAPSPGPVVTVGNFDGVHRGHRFLIDRTKARAAEIGAPTCAYTFHPAPRDVIRPGNPIHRIQTLRDRLASLAATGVDDVVVERFDRDLAARSARWFAEEILGRRLRASSLVLGWDFRFGAGRAGTVSDLAAWMGIPVEQVEPYTTGGTVVSSSRIREAIRAGDLDTVTELLGRPHEVVGTIVHGDARGATLGFPTANLEPETELAPPRGVYAARASVGDTALDAVVNIGLRPSFGEGAPRIEAHLLDFAGDLYGLELRLSFVARLRDERAFADSEALVRQIHADVARARVLLARSPATPR